MTCRVKTRALAVVSVGAFTVLAAGCGTTTIDSGDDGTNPSVSELTGGDDREIAADDTTPLASGVIVDEDAAVATLAVEGSATELLPDIGVDMSRLSSEISDDGDEDETIDRIQKNWAAIENEVREDRPDLVDGIQTTIDMAQTAVDRNRPADADKAFSLLTDFVDSYTGDG